MIEVLSKPEQEELLEKARQDTIRDYTIIKTLLLTGLRVGELVKLCVNDFYTLGEVNHTLKVPKEISKNDKARHIPINPELRKALTDYATWLREQRTGVRPEDPMFQQYKEILPITTRQVERITENLSDKALNRKVHPHALRHTFATELMQVANIRVVQEILGHKNLNSTQIYTHPNSKDMKDAVNKLT